MQHSQSEKGGDITIECFSLNMVSGPAVGIVLCTIYLLMNEPASTEGAVGF